MKVLMLGWEYPPHIAGGLGVACEGLTRALSSHGVEILFVVPKLVGGEQAAHMYLADSFQAPLSLDSPKTNGTIRREQVATKVEVPAALFPYDQPGSGELQTFNWLAHVEQLGISSLRSLTADDYTAITPRNRYGLNVFEEVARYTARVLQRFSDVDCDVIHAHDWMTFPAGVALARLTGKPLVVHVHSLDYDRSGSGRNHGIYEIERMGLSNANAVIAVSHYTKRIVNQEYGVPLERIHVVHNGIYPKRAIQLYRSKTAEDGKRVLFLGRVTLQKGPDYFVRAAAKVLEHIPEVTFVVAGTGDMLPAIVELAHDLGIQDNMHFAGFLNEAEVEAAFSQADLYVMPSVSEPFGLSALEAISFNTPVLMSKQSGVSEVVQHSLKFDFWDVDRMADLIINGLLHEELREDMIDMARTELTRVRWEAAAVRTEQVYRIVT